MLLVRGAGMTEERRNIQQTKRQRTTLMWEFILGERRMISPVGENVFLCRVRFLVRLARSLTSCEVQRELSAPSLPPTSRGVNEKFCYVLVATWSMREE